MPFRSCPPASRFCADAGIAPSLAAALATRRGLGTGDVVGRVIGLGKLPRGTSPTTGNPPRPGSGSGMRAARREASARIRAIASSSALADCSSERADVDADADAGRGGPVAGSAVVGGVVAPGRAAAACAGSAGFPFPRVSPGSSSSPSASRSRITLRGRKCSRCWRSTQRSRSTSWFEELAVPRRRPLGVHQALALEEADLRDGDVGELLPEQRQDVADGEVRAAGHSLPATR